MFSLSGLVLLLLLLLQVAVVLGIALLFVRLATRIVRREWDRARSSRS